MTEEFLSDPRIVNAVTPEVLQFLRDNQAPADTGLDEEIGHWIGVTACVLTELAQAKQKIRELEADK
ncbi:MULTISPECIES: hypothetical protein [unclassified Arthrobacter]|uniref:hypothetical protein n=1 Tax=unclassified Arthrobacter TaxID=235627 RepID=UPI001C84DB2E|nr:hypothetical protein [Arthrobacter sp. MAHUQ-56]MBX7444690.1 hypothetical protein [Arthrobacter sp. MAHUQ-56]